MRLRSILWFSWKNLWAHRLRSLLTIGGVSIGIASIVFLVSIGFGLERLVTNQVANFNAFTILDVPSANLKTGKINEESIERIQKVPHIVSIDRVVDLAGRIRLKSQDSTTETVVVGADPNYFELNEIVAEDGKFFTKDSKEEIVINKSLAGLLGYGQNPTDVIGKQIAIELIIPEDLRAADATEGPITKTLALLNVIGFTGDSQTPIAYMPLGLVQSQGVKNNTSLKLKVEDRKYIEEVRKGIENTGFSTEYVGDTVDQITQVFLIFLNLLSYFS